MMAFKIKNFTLLIMIVGKRMCMLYSETLFPLFQIYSAWETDEVIVFELWRNLALAMVCVFFITLILLADFKICLMVSAVYSSLSV